MTRQKGHDTLQAMEEKAGFTEMFLRLVAIVGLIAVLILGAWGIILLAFNLVGIFTGSVDLKSLFTSKTPTEEVATTPVVTTKPTTSTSKPTTSGTVTQAQPTAVYNAAPRVSQLYGLADLKVTITSVNSLSSYQGRTVVQFMVENAGTNIALSGWSFNAQLPMVNAQAYTYQSQGQQALYPGDSIAYTLTYDDPNARNMYPCTTQYPNNNCTYQYNNGYNYNNYQYPNNGTCYTFNGYQNIPGPCPLGYDQNGNPLYGSNNQYYYQQNYYNPNYNYNYNQNYGYRTVSVTVDPQNWVQEAVEYNNTSSKSF